MAIAYVRDTGKIVSDNVSSSGGSFATLPVVGNHVFVPVSNYSFHVGNISGVADNQSNSYNIDKQQTDGAANNNTASSISSTKVATSSGTFTVTVTPGAAASYLAWSAIEFSGIASASWLDKTGAGSGTTGANAATVTASGANTQAAELVIAVMTLFDNVGSTNFHIVTPTTGYSAIYVEQDGLNHEPGQGSYKIISGSETSSASWNHDSAAGWSAVIATYEAAAGGTTVTPGVLALTTTKFAPTVATPVAVTPGVLALSITTFILIIDAPTTLEPGVRALTITGFAPIITTTGEIVPGTRALTITKFAPGLSINKNLTPGVKALTITLRAPKVPRLAHGTAEISVQTATGELETQSASGTLSI